MAEYTPGRIVGGGGPNSEPTASELSKFIQEELDRLSETLRAEMDLVQLRKLYVEPAKPREGMVVLADGTEWDPGSGAGYYGYYGAAWVKLG